MLPWIPTVVLNSAPHRTVFKRRHRHLHGRRVQHGALPVLREMRAVGLLRSSLGVDEAGR